MRLTLKKEATKPVAKNFLQQQERFDRFLHDRTITITVTQRGRVCIDRREVTLSQVFAGQKIGIRGQREYLYNERNESDRYRPNASELFHRTFLDR